MNKCYKLLLFIFVTFIFNIYNVKAEDCDSNDIARMKELSKRITYDYEFVGNNDGYTGSYQDYKVIFSGLGDDFYIKYEDYGYHDGEEIIVTSGNKTFNVYSSKCYYKITTVGIDLLKFNEYSVCDICDGRSDEFKECEEWYQGNISYEDLKKMIYDYDDEQVVDYENDNFFKKYYYVGIIFVVIVIICFVVYRVKKNKLD